MPARTKVRTTCVQIAVYLLLNLKNADAGPNPLPDCLPAAIVPEMFQGGGTAYEGSVLGVPLTGNYTLAENGLVHYGSSFFGAGNPPAGVVTRVCFANASFLNRSVGDGVYVAVLADIAVDRLTAVCFRFFFVPQAAALAPAGSTYVVYGAFFPSWHGNPPCDPRPFTHLFSMKSFDVHKSVVSQCALEGVVPLELQQPFVNTTASMEFAFTYITVPSVAGFTSNSWAHVQSSGTSIENCVLSVSELPAELSGLPGTDKLWQVIFGDGYDSVPTTCGWFARIGPNLTFHLWLSSSGMHCGDTLTYPSTTLPNYWAPHSNATVPSASPSPSGTPPGPRLPQAGGLSVGAIAGISVSAVVAAAALVALVLSVYVKQRARSSVQSKPPGGEEAGAMLPPLSAQFAASLNAVNDDPQGDSAGMPGSHNESDVVALLSP
jgi:hypothetical protein